MQKPYKRAAQAKSFVYLDKYPIMKRHFKFIALGAALMLCAPAQAVFNERDLGQTIQVLRYELQQDYDKMVSYNERMSSQYGSQRRQMIAIMKKCNELSLMLYSQKQDYTFDLSYALESVTREYNDFNSKRMPFDQIVGQMDLEIERYSRLLESLRRLPPQIEKIDIIPDSLAYHNDSIRTYQPRRPQGAAGPRTPRDPSDTTGRSGRPFILDEQGQIDRDSCITYASALLMMYDKSKRRIVADSTHYEDVHRRLKESYDYAQERYKVLQNKIFHQGQTAYPTILKSFGRYWKRAWSDCQAKYSRKISGSDIRFVSEWRGPSVLFFIVWEIVALILCIGAAALVLIPLSRIFKSMKTEKFRNRKLVYILLGGLVLYAILFAGGAIAGRNFAKVASSLVATYIWLLAAVLLSLIIHLDHDQLGHGLRLYLPMMVMAIIVIGFRIIFLPNRMMNIIFPPMLLLFLVWQLMACLHCCKYLKESDKVLGWLSFTVIAVSFVLSVAGYIFVALLVLVWMFFQMAAIQTLIALYNLLEGYRTENLAGRVKEYKKSITFVSEAEKNKFLFGATWFYDLVKMAAIPTLVLLSIPLCLKLALGVFDFSDLYEGIYMRPFINLSNAAGDEMLNLSLYRVVTATALFFVFKYINYAVHAIFLRLKYASFLRKHERNMVRSNEINISLGNSFLSVLIWFVYIVIVVVLLKIPTKSLTMVATGLSAGIGLALKDVLNNFIYGIQLMSGRLRVGDWIECEGIRGKVTDIGYQSTQIETLDGAVMSFLNTSLFSSNFRNLTRNNSYEFLKIPVGVSYGTDVQKVREVILEALEPLRTKDQYGREIVDPHKGISVTFNDFGDSAVEVAVKQQVLVSERIGYSDRAREAIYNALAAAGIEIPFPQSDIHIKTS